MIKYFLPLLLILACNPSQEDELYSTRFVIDGDTIILEDGSEKGMKVRLIGINAPESRDFKHRRKEAYGKEARAHMIKLLNDKRVRIEFDVEKQDRYGRILAYVFSEDGTFINGQMVKDGYAELMTIAPNVSYVSELTKNQAYARRNGKGMWSDLP